MVPERSIISGRLLLSFSVVAASWDRAGLCVIPRRESHRCLLNTGQGRPLRYSAPTELDEEGGVAPLSPERLVVSSREAAILLLNFHNQPGQVWIQAAPYSGHSLWEWSALIPDYRNDVLESSGQTSTNL